MNTEQMAEVLLEATQKLSPIDAFTNENPSLTLETAYEVQRFGLGLREKEGAETIGYKMGLTSLAKQRDVGVNAPICGYLLENMEITDGVIDCKKYIHPRVEPEIVIQVEKPLKGRQPLDKIFSSVSFAGLGIEVLDSRYDKFKFKLPDVVADNTSASGYITGQNNVKDQWEHVRLSGVVVRKNGEVVQSGAPASVLGNPLMSVQLLLKELANWGKGLEPGMIVLTGGITASVTVQPGDKIECEWPFEKIEVSVQ